MTAVYEGGLNYYYFIIIIIITLSLPYSLILFLYSPPTLLQRRHCRIVPLSLPDSFTLSLFLFRHTPTHTHSHRLLLTLCDAITAIILNVNTVPTADADILLDLHHIHHRKAPSYHHQQQHTLSSTSDLRGSSSGGGNMEQAYSTQHQQHPSYSFNDGSNNTALPSSSRGHSHSLSLGHMPSSSSASSASYAYDHHNHNQQQYGAQQQQQHNNNTSNHSRSFSANDSLLLHSPYLSAAAAHHGTSSSNGGDSNPTSRTQTISPLMAHPSLPGSSSSNLGQSLHYSQGLGLAGVPTSPDPSSHAGGVYAPMPSYMQHLPPHQQHQQPQHSMQYHMHGAITPPSPSTGHASSIRHSHSLSDGSLSYTPQSYASTASSLPSSYHPGLAGTSSNNKYDPHSLPDILAHHHQHHSNPHHAAATSSSSSSYPPYPLSTSAQGFMTIYTTSPTYGSKDSQINLEVGVAPHDPHYIRGFRVLFGSHGTTTRVVGESRSEGEERVELVAVVPPIQLTNRIPPNGTTCQLSLQALDESGKVADWADLGVFEFTGKSWFLFFPFD